MWAALLGGGWWVLALIGFLACAGVLLVAVRFCRTGRGCMCMGGLRNTTHDAASSVPGIEPTSR